VSRRTALAALGAVALVLIAAAAASAQPPLFTWRVPSHFVPGPDGRLHDTPPGQVGGAPRRVVLEVGPAACPAATDYRWFVDGAPADARAGVGCSFDLQLPTERAYQVRLVATVHGRTLSDTQQVRARDFVIVSIGDSVGSGEGVPDVPGLDHARWSSARCHRSERASPAQAAARAEADDEHSSVTFVHLACSGATIPKGLLGPYAGAEPPPDEPPLPAQLDELERVARQRPIDAVILNVGANDVHFGDVARRCAQFHGPDCFKAPFGESTLGGEVEKSLRALPVEYTGLARRLARSVEPGRVHIVQYFDPTTDDSGHVCRASLPNVSASELTRARTDLLAPLNRAVAATRRFGWDVVTGVPERFVGHGYCARKTWITRLERSVTSLGGHLAGRLLGTLHPNAAGQRGTADLVAPAVELSLLGRRFEAPPAEEANSASVAGVVAIVIAGLLLVLAVGWVVRCHLHLVAFIAIGLLGLATLAMLVLAFLTRDEPAVARSLAFGAGAAAGAALVTLWFRVQQRAPSRGEQAEVAAVAAAVALVGVAVGFSIYAFPQGLLLVVGLVAGVAGAVLVARRVQDTRVSWLAPSAGAPPSLPRTAAPALLPLLAVAAIGTLNLPAWVPPLVGLAVAFAATLWIVRPEVSGELSELQWLIDKAELFVVLAVGVVVLTFVTGLVTKPAIDWLDGLGGLPAALLFTALVVWVIAIGLRLFSYATTLVRSIVSVALALLIVRGLMYVGVLPGDDWLRDHVAVLDTIAVIACVAIAVAGIALDVFPQLRRATGASDRLVRRLVAARPSRAAAGRGLAAGLLAAVVVGAATIAGMVETRSQGSDRLPAGSKGLVAEVPPDALPADDGALARTYAPVLAFTKDERWAPTTVESYLADAKLLAPGGGETGPPLTLAGLPRTCPPGSGRACFRLTIDCPTGDDDCSGHHLHPAGEIVRDGAAYVRVVRGPFARLPSYLAGKNLAALVQYWFFYRYDEWQAHVLAGRLVQRHEGDWEAVMVGVGRNRPLFVAYSAHCGGTWLPWNRIRMSALSAPYTHPLVAVAEGSHANYPTAGPQSPNFTSCSRIPDGTLKALSYAGNIRERTAYDWQWYPDQFALVGDKDPPMSFPGHWGLHDRSVLENFAHHPPGPSGGGPKTPRLQPLWADPLRTVFCNQYWHGPRGVRVRCPRPGAA
jgi:lysophospholipase L1-like esterase